MEDYTTHTFKKKDFDDTAWLLVEELSYITKQKRLLTIAEKEWKEKANDYLTTKEERK